jgi:hypothetical protein
MKLLRIIAIIGALALMVGEAYRSWGVGRPIAFWMDDMLAGGLLIASTILVGVPTVARRAFFTGAWGISVGMLYSSFFGKVFAPQDADPGNFDLGLLTGLLGLAFAIAVAGMVMSIVLPSEKGEP